MIDKDTNFLNEMSKFFFKIFIPAFVAISIKIATQIKREEMNFTKIIISFIVGVGCAYFIFPFIQGSSVNTKYTPILVGVVAMSGEKIAEYIIYKWDIDKIFNVFIDFLIDRLKNK